MNELVLFARTISDPTRVRILAALRGRELCVCELCDALEISQSTLSTHLQVIRDAGLVKTRKQGKWIYYTTEPTWESFLESVFEFFTRNLRRDVRVQRDAGRIKKRLSERDGGECCRGFEQQCCPPRRRNR